MSSRSPTAHAARHLRDAHEETHQHPVRDQRGTAVRHEREGDAGERYEPEIPSDDDERLQRHDERQPTGEQLEEHRRGAERDQHSAVEEHEVEGEQGERAGEPGLLSERVEDEVAPDHRYPVRHAVPKTGPEESAVRDSEEALNQLVTASEAEVFVERPKPRIDARLHVPEELIRDETAEDEEAESDDRVERFAGREEQHRQEDPEEEHG